MAILFYDHLIIKTEILSIISGSEAEENQKGKVLQLVDDIYFQSITKYILSSLDEKHHKTFLIKVHEKPYDPDIIVYLRDHLGDDVEDQIKKEAERITQKILKDLSE